MFGIFKKFQTTKQAYKDAQTAQRELIVAFNALGRNFMHLHPTIHGALMKEAMVTGTEATIENFIKLVDTVGEYEPANDDQKADVLLEIYRERGKKFAEERQARFL